MRRWLDNIRNDLSDRELSGEEVQDRVKLRRLTRNMWERMRKKKLIVHGCDQHEEKTHIGIHYSHNKRSTSGKTPFNIREAQQVSDTSGQHTTV